MRFPGKGFHVRGVCCGGLLTLALGLVLVQPISAQAASGDSRMKTCSKEWSAAKDAGKVPAGQNWQTFYSQCSARLKAQDSARQKDNHKPGEKTSASGHKPEGTRKAANQQKPGQQDTKNKKDGKKELTSGQRAAQERQKTCGAEWRKQKAAGKIPAGQKWPQFWSDCNARLKRSGR